MISAAIETADCPVGRADPRGRDRAQRLALAVYQTAQGTDPGRALATFVAGLLGDMAVDLAATAGDTSHYASIILLRDEHDPAARGYLYKAASLPATGWPPQDAPQ